MSEERPRSSTTGRMHGEILSPSHGPRFQEAVQAMLRLSPYREVRDVACSLEEGVLTLRGRVPSYYLKQMVQVVVLQMDGVFAVNNCVEVG